MGRSRVSGARQNGAVTRVLAPSDEAYDDAVGVLRAGGLVAVPTETVYGLGADAANDVAVGRVFAAKDRPADHPLIVHVADAATARSWAGAWPPAAAALADAFWPGPLTLIVPRAAHVGDAVTGGRPTVGLRVPDSPVTLELLRRFGGGIAAPSANRFGRVSPTTAAHVAADLGGDVDLVLDGGPCGVGVESTIVEVLPVGDGETARLTLLRAGAITAEDVTAVTGLPVDTTPTGPSRAPGMLPSHYAPRARVLVAEPADVRAALAAELAAGHRVALLGVGAHAADGGPAGGASVVPDPVVVLGPVGDPRDYARRLYQCLRDADAAGADVVVAVPPEPVGIGLAVRDRLARAAHPR